MRIALVSSLLAATSVALVTGSGTPAAASSRIATFSQAPLAFEANKGQTDSRVRFVARNAGQSVFLLPTEAVVALSKPRVALRISLVGADRRARMHGVGRLPGRTNYFIGNDPRMWRRNISSFGKVRAQSVYPGIDAVYYGSPDGLEFDFVVRPGADLSRIHLSIGGAHLSVDGRGDVVLGAGGARVRLRRPRIYQGINGQRREIVGAYVRNGDELRFRVAPYDRSRPLVIDPTLAYSTYLGGSDEDGGNAIAVDASGDVYVTGVTDSPNFPVSSGGYQPTFSGAVSTFNVAFVTKLDPSRSGAASRIYSTYLGGTHNDGGFAIAVDGAGHPYVAGLTNSPDFPVIQSPGLLQAAPFQPALGGGADGFVTKLTASGGDLLYSTFLGGSNSDSIYGIAVGPSGDAYVTGETDSANFPVTSGAVQTHFGGIQDAFTARIDPTKQGSSSLLYSTFLGGSGADQGRAIAVDKTGSAYVTGDTSSIDFPVDAQALQATNASAGHYPDVFVTKLTADGKNHSYSTYLGGSYDDYAHGIAVDATGNAYVAGYTSSMQYLASTGFPANPGSFKPFPVTSGAFQSTGAAGFFHAFVAKLNVIGAGLSYATLLGGSNSDLGEGVALDSAGKAYVFGYTSSTDFPVTPDAFQSKLNGTGAPSTYADAFVAKLDSSKAAAASLEYSTLLGGSSNEASSFSAGGGIAADASASAYVTGATYSTDFPVTSSAFQASSAGLVDAFVAKISTTGTTETPTPIKPTPQGPNKGIVVSPHEFPYKVTFETRCTESLAGVCLQTAVVRVCVGGNCFAVPTKDTSPGCRICELGSGFGVGLVLGVGGAWLFIRRRNPGPLSMGGDGIEPPTS